jgi:protein phosphatase
VFLNNTVCIDTGCVFGGALSAFRWPEREVVTVPAFHQYYAPVKPLNAGKTPGEAGRSVLYSTDCLGGRRLSTFLGNTVTVSEEAASSALELMSRFAADPRWLIYLPPTMSPAETSSLPDFLEHPREAFDYYKKQGVTEVVCEKKHMGSRAVVIVCKDAETATRRFGVNDKNAGIIYTRTGRKFFGPEQAAVEAFLLASLRGAMSASNFWSDFATDWVCLDCELLPWSAKARGLLVEQYAPAGRAGLDGLGAAIAAVEKANDANLSDLLASLRERETCVSRYIDAYRRYCWETPAASDFRLAPFHVLATEGKAWYNEPHTRHLAVIDQYIADAGGVFLRTDRLVVRLESVEELQSGVDWWLSLTGNGGEGMVVKPLDFIGRDKQGRVLQPALKCRGREYLRIIYGPDYTTAAHLERLKKRSTKRKRRLAADEFSLGLEALRRFVENEPLHRVHECVFAVLALESEKVDPRL